MANSNRGTHLHITILEERPDSPDAAQLIAELPTLGFAPPTLAITRAGGNVELSWTDPAARLQQADAVTGPWSDVEPPATSPHLVSPSTAAKFFCTTASPVLSVSIAWRALTMSAGCA